MLGAWLESDISSKFEVALTVEVKFSSSLALSKAGEIINRLEGEKWEEDIISAVREASGAVTK